MARRLLSQSIRNYQILTQNRNHNLIAGRRRSDKPHIIEVDLAAGDADAEVFTVRRLEDAIHGYIIRKSAPDWLPFVPGASYWVPPKRRSVGLVEVVDRMPDSLTDEELLSRMTTRGWPSLKYYMEGISPHPIKRRSKKAALQSDDED